MSRTKVFISILMVLILIALSGASVWAAPGREEPVPEPTEEPEQPPEEEPISGVVKDIVIEVDDEGTVTVLVTLEDEFGDTQTVRLSLETAVELGLVQVDDSGEPVLDDEGHPIPNDEMLDQPVEIPPGSVIEDGEEDGEEGLHPVASALADFFADTLGLDYDMVMGYHEDGMGFGVIAQACWMSYGLEGDATLLGDILAAKKSHDFSSIDLPDGETPTNWGQFRKAVLSSDKAKKNLGAIMSGRAKKEQEQEQEQDQEQGLTATANQGKNKKGKGSDDGVGGSSTEPPGKGKDKDKDGGPPAEPPGKKKDQGGGPPAEPPGKKDTDSDNDKGGGDKGGGKGKGGGKKN